LNLDLPLSQKEKRNAYRTALINYERAVRELSLKEDEVKLDVRTAWRNLEQAKRNYEIAQKSVELSQRRVEEQNLLAELGRATALDLVDAQNDLTRAQNNLTSAIIAHNIARLEFWKNIGILYIKPDGKWEEIKDVK
ncbi:MAG TPA: TolC family protein, partial [Candidatus Hydrogenedens sp.]|nr:TolC family protein [Candidatus Hydrogenedens sp.]